MTKTHGLLRWKVLPMGFKNSSAYFQRAIEAALGGLRFTCCVVYIDDVVVQQRIVRRSPHEGESALDGFSRNSAKFKFAQRDFPFLGHRVADGKVYALDDKVKAMVDYQAPT